LKNLKLKQLLFKNRVEFLLLNMSDKSFKWDARLYQESSSFQFNLGLMSIERLDPKDGELILEIGSGNARVTIELGKKIPNGKITAVEISEDQCEQAKINLEEYIISNIEIVCMNALEINYNNQFDAVFSNSAIHWIKNLELMYELIYKSLKKDGRILIQTGLKKLTPIFIVIAKLARERKFREYLREFTNPWRFLSKKETEKLLEANNYKNISIEIYDASMKFNTEEELFNYWKAAALVPFLTLLPKEMEETFIKKFEDLYLLETEPNSLKVVLPRLFISAIK